MEKSFSASYAAAGVDVTAGYESVERIKAHVKRTTVPGVLGGDRRLWRYVSTAGERL